MEEGSLRERVAVETALAEARAARAANDGQACVRALRRALQGAAELQDDGLMASACWRLAKAEHDFGEASSMLQALQPVLERPELLEHHLPPLEALQAVSRRFWDHVGYGDPRVEALWDAWTEASAARGDPYLAGIGQSQKAWQLACRGQIEALAALLDRYGRLSPISFGEGPHRYPLAPDTPSSLYRVQLALAQTTLCAATWAGAERLAWEARELLEDALEDAEATWKGFERKQDPWLIETVVRAAARFGWKDAGAFVELHAALLPTLEGPRRALHQALGQAALARLAGDRPDPRPLLEAADLAEQQRFGPEWVADALLEAVRAGAEPSAPYRRVEALVSSRGVRVFERAMAG